MTEDVEMSVEGGALVIKPIKNFREGWDSKFKSCSTAQDELLLESISDLNSEEWA